MVYPLVRVELMRACTSAMTDSEDEDPEQESWTEDQWLKMEEVGDAPYVKSASGLLGFADVGDPQDGHSGSGRV